MEARVATDATLERVLRRDRVLVAGAIVGLAVLAWLYLWRLAAGMGEASPAGGMAMPGMPMPGMEMAGPLPGAWSATDFALAFAMWVVMMVGMMMPSAAPVVLLHARVARQAAAQGHPFAATTWFVAGYLSAWTAFSLMATFGQWVLDRAALLTPMLASRTPALGGAVLIVAGIYQWTPLKRACLTHCRTPLSFIQAHGGFPAEPAGSFRLGVHHGFYCVGCCWLLMALLFVGGVMNLAWIAALGLIVLLEKALPGGYWIARIAGVVAVAAGAWLLAS